MIILSDNNNIMVAEVSENLTAVWFKFSKNAICRKKSNGSIIHNSIDINSEAKFEYQIEAWKQLEIK